MGNTIILEYEKPIIELEKRIEELKVFARERNLDLSDEIGTLQIRCDKLKREIYSSLNSWQRIQLVRHPQRPTALELIDLIFDDFFELHGDRLYGEDSAMVGGIGLFNGQPVTIIAPQKGRDTKENIERNFGLPHPEGYRKAIRLMRQAEKFGRPVVTLVDVVGAYPGIAAEERGQGPAIAEAITVMGSLQVPTVAIITGEGGSGGALALAMGNRVLMLENAYYSVISPESASIILYRNDQYAKEAAEALKISSRDLLEMQIIDEIIPEPLGGAHKDPKQMANLIKEALDRNLTILKGLSKKELAEARYERFKIYGTINGTN
ncbi:MAG: acetyl-CoA carboxylase carboxyltransferase subunit alpha [Firmicutes bacterium]|nr:acetyl-CoA carboxylase carboxyltransferase subunit alpha [Bacillota bacterium]MDD4262935.1 acetyl-CoA carboxylase carboxyltransferase subunit alpha [Bacillota bacterium]MDD4693467.1 acetyl-CoA carboxylase carboxyltransferase subunit alpha [Bacillota bacterium]